MTTATNSPASAAHEEELPPTAVSERHRAKATRQSQALLEPRQAEEEVPQDTTTPEETTWKQRYADLRRHAQSKETTLTKQLQELATQVEQLSLAQSRPLPKTMEEFEKWKSEYPDIVPFIEHIAEEKANARATSLETELTTVKSKLQQTEQEKAYALLKSLVPDIESIPDMPEYGAWLDSLSTSVRERVLGSDDPYEVRDYMAMFKATLRKPERIDTKTAKLSALDTSVKSSSPPLVRNQAQFKFKESDISRMSTAEYAKNEVEIETAMRSGQVLMDITGKKTWHTGV